MVLPWKEEDGGGTVVRSGEEDGEVEDEMSLETKKIKGAAGVKKKMGKKKRKWVLNLGFKSKAKIDFAQNRRPPLKTQYKLAI